MAKDKQTNYRESLFRGQLFEDLLYNLLQKEYGKVYRNVITYGSGAKSTEIDFAATTQSDKYVLIESKAPYTYNTSTIRKAVEQLKSAVDHIPDTKIDRVILALASELPASLMENLLAEGEYFRNKGFAFEVWDSSHIRSLLKKDLGIEVESFSIEEMEKALSSENIQELPPHEAVNLHTHEKSNGRFIARSELESKEYKNVIVVTADFCSYSKFVNASGSDNDLVISVMSRFYEEVSKTIHEHGAVLDKFMGDGVLFYWIVRESFDGVAEVIDSCVGRLIGLSLKLAEEWQEQIDPFVEIKGMRCGGAIGEVLFITEKLSGADSFHAIGDCINVAARLQAKALPNNLAISNVIKTKIFKDDNSFEDISPLELKNIGQIKAWKKSYR
ncbi:MAG TPA: adenylate/guanylate cyclase domain-containing protein [Pyrinomonadaceae bacterium]|nr:adenylate/guanylate cyclase domain-containing protein [Pyrinomonadaceae bacterium]